MKYEAIFSFGNASALTIFLAESDYCVVIS